MRSLFLVELEESEGNVMKRLQCPREVDLLGLRKLVSDISVSEFEQ
jgi:hypothetical protein